MFPPKKTTEGLYRVVIFETFNQGSLHEQQIKDKGQVENTLKEQFCSLVRLDTVDHVVIRRHKKTKDKVKEDNHSESNPRDL